MELVADWTHVVKSSFSIRPSALSPLHGAYKDSGELVERYESASLHIAAQALLADEVGPCKLSNFLPCCACRHVQISSLAVLQQWVDCGFLDFFIRVWITLINRQGYLSKLQLQRRQFLPSSNGLPAVALELH